MVRHPLVLRYALGLLFLFALGTVYAEDAMPSWSQLTQEQQKVLSPLAGEWDTLRPWQREKCSILRVIILKCVQKNRNALKTG